MTKLLLVDCDGTIREPISDNKFIQYPHDQRIIDGAGGALAYYYSRAWTIIGITNQGGVAAGHKSLEDALKEQQYTLELFPQIGCILSCPDMTGSSCLITTRSSLGDNLHEEMPTRVGTFRKPNPGMLHAARALYTNIIKVLYVGDRPEDEAAAAAAGINFRWAEDWRTEAKLEK